MWAPPVENIITKKVGWRHSGVLMEGLHQELNETCRRWLCFVELLLWSKLWALATPNLKCEQSSHHKWGEQQFYTIHAGNVVLLNLKQQLYLRRSKITCNAPLLRVPRHSSPKNAGSVLLLYSMVSQRSRVSYTIEIQNKGKLIFCQQNNPENRNNEQRRTQPGRKKITHINPSFSSSGVNIRD